MVQWGDNPEDKHQLDVVAIGEEAIFVVECKATENIKQASFKKDIDDMRLYKDGVMKALRQIYGEGKKVKFVFATRNYTFAEGCEDEKRLAENKIFQFTDNTYDYVNSLIKSYRSTVIYQFYGLMFRHERINSDKIRIPALKGTMGGHTYYMLSIEPATLLKIGFVLHRTRVNTQITMPTYQRLLVPSRLKGIREFIDKKNGYFPNSVIINFDNQDWTDLMNLQDYKEIIESNWSVKKDDESFVTFEKEFAIPVSDSFKTKTDKLKWIKDLISYSKAWTTTKGRALSQAEVNEMKSILQSLVPTEEFE